MVRDRLTDGKRIAQLLASEIDGGGGGLADLSVEDARPDVEPTVDGALAYAVVRAAEGDGDGDGGERLAEVYVQPDRARIELLAGQAEGAEAAADRGLRVRPKAVRPPRTLVFVEDGAQVKWALPAFEAAAAALDADGPVG
ncbi:hypothetical protein [Halegenticoccus soli]|uniref:hypothetical protein n=1 Tax=Halegenticoccus soli TaxID=1985678 RepID=UPI000C6E6972|nr:hypothetical protein [Halegenticoccus soli]